MSFPNGLSITNKGRALQAKAQTGVALKFTKMQIGDGALSGQLPGDMTALISPKKDIALVRLEVLTDGKAEVSGFLSNTGVVTGFYFREWGLFATDPDDGEILYCYGNAASAAEYIPAGGGADVLERYLSIIAIVGNAPNVSATVGSEIYATELEFQNHLTDYIRQPGYGTTAGSANAYTLALNPALTAYTAGVGVVVKIHAANTGASTINLNGLGAKAIKDGKGNALTSGKLRLNGMYALRYDGTDFILLGEGGDYGTAEAPQVLTGYTVGTDSGIINGSMPHNGAVTITPSGTAQPIAAGYHNGSGVVNAVVVPTAKVLNDTTIAGQSGTMPNNGPASAETVNLTTEGSEYTIAAGYHSGLRKIKAVISGLVASVIKAGVTVGGIVGTFTADATAIAAQMLAGVTAYVNGVKVTGIMPNRANDQPAIQTWTDGAGSLAVGFPTGAYITDSGFGAGKASVMLSDPDFKSVNIRQGIDVFGVTGSLAGILAGGTGTGVDVGTNFYQVFPDQYPYVQFWTVPTGYYGVVRISFQLQGQTSNSTVTAQICKGGDGSRVPVGTLRSYTGQNWTVIYTEDIAVNGGDILSLRFTVNFSGQYLYYKSLSVSTNFNLGSITFITKTN